MKELWVKVGSFEEKHRMYAVDSRHGCEKNISKIETFVAPKNEKFILCCFEHAQGLKGMLP